MADFTFNDCKVCTNPHIAHRIEIDPRHYLTIETARDAKGWIFGYNLNCADHGSTSPCMRCENDIYESEDKAVIAALKWVSWLIDRGNDKSPAEAKLRARIGGDLNLYEITTDDTTKQLPKGYQMTIFDVM